MLGGNVLRDVHFCIFSLNDIAFRNASFLQFQLQHFKDRRFSAAANTGKDFYDWLVDEGRDRVHIIWSEDQGYHLRNYIIPENIAIYKKFLMSDTKNFRRKSIHTDGVLVIIGTIYKTAHNFSQS